MWGLFIAPAPDTIVAFIDTMAEIRAPATVRRYVASIATFHRAAGLDSPTKALPVKLALKRMHRAKGRMQKQAAPLNEAEFRRCLAATGDRLIDKRDKALLAVGRVMLARRSELVSLLVDDLQTDADGGASILLRRSKGDQEGQGAVVYLPRFAAELVRRWLWAAGVANGPIFRSVDRTGKVGETLHPAMVGRIIAKMAKRADIDTALTGHSLRVGMAQDLTAAGFELSGIMQAGRWKSPEMPARYSARLSAKSGAVAGYYAE